MPSTEVFAHEAVRVWRELARSPLSTAIIILTLILGVGPSSAVFELVNGLLLKPLPYPGGERIAVLWQTADGGDPREVVPANFRDWQQRSRSFESLAAFTTREVNLGGTEHAERLTSNLVTSDFFSLLGAKAAHGRTLGKGDFDSVQVQPAVISYALWRRSFGGDPQAIGHKVLINSLPYTLVGVMPPGFQLAEPADLWAPLLLSPAELADRSTDSLVVIGKLRPGVTLPSAQGEMTAIAARLAHEYPDTNTGSGIFLINLREQLVGGLHGLLFALVGAALVVLVIAVVNVVQLLLIRADQRQRAVALRVAFGGRRANVLWPLLVEAVTLAVIGGLGGLLLAGQLIGLLVKVLPPFIPNRESLGIDLAVVLFTLALSALVGVLVGLIPAFGLFRVDLTKIFKATSTQGGAAGRPILQKLLVVSEVGLALLLLCTAGLLVRSFLELRQTRPGFEPDNLLVTKLVLPSESYPEDSQVLAFDHRLRDSLASLPGVRSVGAVSKIPFGGSNSTRFFIVEGRPVPAEGEQLEAYYRVVTAEFFRTMGIPLLSGPGFASTDDDRATPKVVVSKALADQVWPSENAVGKRISTRVDDPIWMEVVGVAGNVKHWGLDDPKTPFLYTVLAQRPDREMTWVIRASGPEADIALGIRSLVRSLDPNLPVSLVPMTTLMERSMVPRRVSALLFAVMSIVAFLLGMVGLYSVMHYLTARRRREFAIKLALGAQRSTVLVATLRQGFWLVLTGLAIGLGASLAASRVVESLLFGIDALDAVTLICTPLVVAAVGLLAVLVPARWATDVEPLEALRAE